MGGWLGGGVGYESSEFFSSGHGGQRSDALIKRGKASKRTGGRLKIVRGGGGIPRSGGKGWTRCSRLF